MLFGISRKKIGTVAQALATSIETHPDKWRLGKHTAFIGQGDEYSGDGKIRVWIANGLSHVRLYEPWEIEFNSMERKLVWQAIEKLRRGDAFAARFLKMLAQLESEQP